MLLQFKIQNYRSFKDEAVLSLEAQRTDDSHPDNFTAMKKDLCLKTLAIFGANAAGKSNLFKALTAAIMTIRGSNAMNAGQELALMTPFMFDGVSAEQPTCFEFVFVAGEKKYVYRFSATHKKVFSEELLIYKSAKASLIFKREGQKYKYTLNSYKTQLEPIERFTGENKLFLSTASAFNCEAVMPPYAWFAKDISTYSPNGGEHNGLSVKLFDSDADSSLHNFTSKLLHWADVNIDDFEFKCEDFDREKFLQGMPQELRGLIPENLGGHPKMFQVHALHRFSQGGTDTEYKLPFNEESAGTSKLFYFSPILKRAFENGETVCVDELDTSFHPLLITQLVSLFHNPSVNKNNAQLIFSAHTAELLTLEKFRRDQIYFASKNGSTGASSLNSLDEYSPRLNENIKRSYLLGRYGAVPDIAQDFAPWEPQ